MEKNKKNTGIQFSYFPFGKSKLESIPIEELDSIIKKKEIIQELDSLNTVDRFDIFSEYCTHCGDKNPGCQCWNDE